MNNEDIRQRRLQRLAMVQNAQSSETNSFGSSSSQAPTKFSEEYCQPEIGKSDSVPSDPAKQPAKQQLGVAKPPLRERSEHKEEPTKPPQVQQLAQKSDKNVSRKAQTVSKHPKPPAGQSDLTIADVLDIKSYNSPKTWHDIGADELGALLFEEISSGNRKPISYLISCYNRTNALSRHLPDAATMLKDQLITLTFVSASAAEDDEVYGNFIESLVEAAFSQQLDPKFVHELMQLGMGEEEFVETLVSNCAIEVQNLVLGDPKTSAVFQVLDLMLSDDAFAERALRLPRNPVPSTTYLSMTLLGKIINKGFAYKGFLDLIGKDEILNSDVPELIDIAQLNSPVSEVLEGLQFSLVNKLIRKNSTTRRLVLNWFGAVLNVNHGQIATMRSSQSLNTLQMMINCFKILLRLSEPFVRLDATLKQQLSKINPDYFQNKLSYDIDQETKVTAAQNAPFNSKTSDTQLNFVTECFYLTAGFLQFGLHAATEAINGTQRLDQLEIQLRNLDTDPRIQQMPLSMRQLATDRYKGAIIHLKSEIAGLTSYMLQPLFLEQAVRFSEFTLAFCVCAAQNRLNHKPTTLGNPDAFRSPHTGLDLRIPWEEDPPENYASFPEFLIEAPSACVSFILRTPEFIRSITMSGEYQLLFDTAMFFMSSPKVLRNPYLRGKFVELLYFGGADIKLTTGAAVPGPLSGLFTSSDTCRKHLLHALMSVFIDIEHTGRTSQFYEKFTTREFVAKVLKVLWRDPHYRNQLVVESEEKPQFFVKFVALLLNDATYLLDEALGKLLELHKLENSPESATNTHSNQIVTDSNGVGDNNRNENARIFQSEDRDGEANEEESEEENDPEARLRSAESQAKNFLDLSKSTVTLLNEFTKTVPSIFATPEIIDRFAVMLNYNLAALVGPRCRELRVRNPASLGFNPRQLLTDIVQIYLNLRTQSQFPKAIAKDERSYKDETFAKALSILKKYNLLSPINIDDFYNLSVKVKEAFAEALEEDKEFGDDIPDEFLDPLMYTLMEDPVILPTSRVNIDLSTIKTHLLSDSTDPFNRVPLTIEEVIPNTELKQKIEEFKMQKKAQRQEDKMKD